MSEKHIPQYVPLYKKYRPKNLAEVVGQEHVKKALSNAISLNKTSHAYLFTGSRGTGKTSVARILAKSLNCDKGPTLTPCEVCQSCISITNSNQIDVFEIDAASNRKVEEIENNILGKVLQVREGKYKIYIIDEVHMLTNHAFNALLKTLEEPPENVIFILATTEPQKVLETITSRCQRFDFRRITTDDIISHLKSIVKTEKIKIDDEALFTIAKNSAGGMRDSLALLDQVSVLGDSKTITSEDVNRLLGRLSFDMLNNLSQKIIESKPQEAIELLETIYNGGNEPAQVLINLMGYLKNLLIVKNCAKESLLTDLTQLNNSQIQILKKQTQDIETHQIVFLIEKTVYYIKELKTTTNQHLWLEIAIIDLANLTQNTSLLELQERLSKLESGINTVSAPLRHAELVSSSCFQAERGLQGRVSERQSASIKQPPLEETKNEVKTTKNIEKEKTNSKEDKNSEEQEENSSTVQPFDHSTSSNQDMSKLWLELLQNISSTPTVSLLTQHARPVEISTEKIIISCRENFLKMLNSDSKKAFIEEGARKLFNKSVNIVISASSNQNFSGQNFSVDEKKNLNEENAKGKAQRAKEQENGKLSLRKGSETTYEAIQKHPSPQPSPTKGEGDSSTNLSEEKIDEEDEYIEHEIAKKKPEKFVPSDQVSMVMNLFDGKYIE